MGYFNPISYFIKSFIRLFTKKFFWIILLCIGIFVGYLLFNNGVFAESNYTLIDNYFTDSDINRVKSIMGDKFNNDDYNIFLIFRPSTVWEKTVFYYNISDLPSNSYYYSDFNSYDSISDYGSDLWRFGFIRLRNDDNVTYNVTDFNAVSLYKNLSEHNDTRPITSSVARWSSLNNSPSELYVLPIKTTFDWIDNTNNVIFNATNPPVVSPYFITTDEQLQTFDFDYLQINGGTTPYYTEISEGVGGNATLSLRYIYSGVETIIDLSNYITVNSDNTWSVNIPYNALTNNVIVRNGEEFSYVFTYTPFYRFTRNCK